jgi:hypothetical protein
MKIKDTLKHPLLSQLWVAAIVFATLQLYSLIKGMEWADHVVINIDRPLWQLAIIITIKIVIIRLIIWAKKKAKKN